MPVFIDTHCHLDDSSLSSRLAEVLAAGSRAGVAKYVVPGVTVEGWEGISSLSRLHGNICPAFGLHPMRAADYRAEHLGLLRDYAGEAVAIGEIGLDYLLHEVPRETQLQVFRAQLRLAVELGLPVLIHCRKAFRDLLAILREEHVERVGGVMHAFSGSPETARECIRLGLLISVSGTVTWRNAVRPLEVVRSLPLEHLALETDAPDMTPEPLRGRNNEPAFMVETARKVAELKGVSLEEVARVTTANAERVLSKLQISSQQRF